MFWKLLGPHRKEDPSSVRRPFNLRRDQPTKKHSDVPGLLTRFNRREIKLTVFTSLASAKALAVRRPSDSVIKAQFGNWDYHFHFFGCNVVNTHPLTISDLNHG